MYLCVSCLCVGLLEGYVAEKATLEESLQQKEAQEERLVEELEGLRAQLHQMDGLTAELEGLRVQLHQKEGLTSELEDLRVQLQELSEEHSLLQRQKVHLTAGLGEREKGEGGDRSEKLWFKLNCD